MKDFREAAEKYARAHSSAPDKETSDWIINDFTAGCEHGYSEAKKEVREFYLLVREFVTLHRASDNTLIIDEYQKLLLRLSKSLASFTEQEQKELPFE